jgi:lipoprotein-anchoring transpeptidase ErfK/SrfK
MQSRFVAALLVAASLGMSAVVAQAQMYDPEGRYSGGNPRPRGGALFGMIGGYGPGPVPRTTVSYPGNHAPGTIIVNTTERRLYLVQEGGTALRYGIGVGRVGFTWAGTTSVVAKKEWPSWTPPAQMLRRRPDLPRFMKGGEDNPLGARAMYLGSSLYRIHGSNEPETIGQAVSSGCFRLTNDDVIDLYSRVRVGARVIVMR